MKCTVSALVMAIVLFACGPADSPPIDDAGPTPPIGLVDGPFVTVVSDLVAEVSLPQIEEGEPFEVDVIARFDGAVDLVSRDAPFPDVVQSRLTAIPVTDGLVDFAGTYRMYGDGAEYGYTVVGSISPAALDLKFVFSGYAGRKQSFRLSGRPRALKIPAELDGFYNLTVKYYGLLCDDQPLPVTSVDASQSLLNVRDFGDDKLRVELDYFLLFDLPRPNGSNGQVEHEGAAKFFNGRFYEYTGFKASGTFSADKVDLRLDLGWSDPDKGICPEVWKLTGGKMVPTATGIEGLYRGLFKTEKVVPLTDGDDPIPDYYGILIALPYPDGQHLRVMDQGGSAILTRQTDGHWTYAESEIGYDFLFDFSPNPPDLDLNVISRGDADGDGHLESSLTITFKATKRFIFPE